MTVETSSVLPARMKTQVVDQIDHVLKAIGSSDLIAISLFPGFSNGHVATPTLLKSLEQIEDISFEWQSVSKIAEHGLVNQFLLYFNERGDSFLVMDRRGDEYYLQCGQYDGKSETFWITVEKMLTELKILPQALSITKKNPTSAIGQPLLPPPSKDTTDDDNAGKEHYAIKHFRLQSRTALSIIGISVVIALLGVITPLGFQTFTDKILPYQAQSSLMVIAILLVVAAMMTALFNYYRDYQESVLFAKYQSGLGKEVFSRLLAMEVPYFDLVT